MLKTTDANSRARKGSTKPKPAPKPQLRGIDGALSIYRKGDVVCFAVEGVELEGVVHEPVVVNGNLFVHVETHLNVNASIIKRRERAA
jgi:hypothetical protein